MAVAAGVHVCFLLPRQQRQQRKLHRHREVQQQHLLLLLLLLVLMVASPSRVAGLTDDGKALDDMRQALRGDAAGAFASWDINLVSPCTWQGVTCGGGGDGAAADRVTELLLPDKHLSGELSPRLGDLPFLRTCKMSNNNISGEIPAAVANLTHLTALDLGSNRLTGPLPPALGGLQALQLLVLRNNRLAGDIPPALLALPALRAVDLSNNDLSGRVPPTAPGVAVNVTGNPQLCGESVRVQCSGDPPLAPPEAAAGGGGGKGVPAGLVGAVVAGLAAAAAAGTALGVWLMRRGRRGGPGAGGGKEEYFDVREEQDPQIRYAQLREFTLRELQAATDHFHSRNVLGKGGFSKVYKGTLEDGSQVAVKRLLVAAAGSAHAVAAAGGGERAFQTEVEMISLAVHRNLLRLQGFCVTQSERILVYPYMRNGSVAQRLRDTTNAGLLDWPARRNIALGAARGLAYLHDFCEPKIIHRDVKAANVLLDDDLEAVVGDFGLAKLLDGSQTHITTMVRGTAGHIAPEYLTTGKSSDKTDVFGYGIMLLELITGQRAFDFARLAAEDDVMLLDWVKRLQQDGRLEELVDPNLRGGAGKGYDPTQAEELIQVALLCTQAAPGERPRMAEVVRMLEGDGLAERWHHWQRLELVRARERDTTSAMLLPTTRSLPVWMHDSTSNLDAIQLSSGR